jgi:PKD domain
MLIGYFPFFNRSTLLPGGDFTYTYTPDPTYVGNDSFTYLGFGSDGQISNLATVNLTINNIAHTYTDNGNYQVTLTVTDKDVLISSRTFRRLNYD